MIELPILGQDSAESTEGPILGIDLGTTHSLVAVLQHGAPRVLAEGEGNALIPSVVSYPQDGPPVVGKAALARAGFDPQRTIYSCKRLVGRGMDDLRDELATLPYQLVEADDREMALIDLGDRRITPQEVCGRVLSACRELAASELKLPMEQLTRAVITVPAYFDDAQRQATRRAAKLAGLDVLRMVGEPTAAALAYGLDKSGSSRVAVFDLGGGTFDLSILELQDGVFRVLSTSGDTHLGGDDFDRAIMVNCAAEIQQQSGVDVLSDPGARAALRLISERTKKALSSAEEADFVYHDPDRGVAYRRTIDWRTFQGWVAPLVQRTLDSCSMALQDADLTPEDIHEVVLVGGSTRVPLVKAAVSQFFGRTCHDSLDPDTVVALGAAIQAGVLGGQVQNALLLDVTPLSLGIATAEGTVSKLILRNATIPAMAKEGFTTFVDGQTAVKFTILQGERELAKDCRELGEFVLRGIPPMPAGLPQVGVRFHLDADGVLHVRAKEERSGASAAITVKPKHGLTDEEVETMLADAWENAESDLVTRQVADLHGQLSNVRRAVEKHLEVARKNLGPQELERLEEAYEDASDASDITEPGPLKGILDELETAAHPLAEALMNHVASDAVRNRNVTELIDE
ncbi:MAG: Fe-S protein assembly chaperone HscA [Planctomycetes bacterium]|nr:Fe-S protein assembly chaperone HscA [Planctomycetota bacterium]MCP4771315.1 Fe-S protein assembly chaperone HscA [Planctomycetota bacterium]MCP4860452.1 Fe-S protein assembly chaperone HscA [Planctomycetota bacterium]